MSRGRKAKMSRMAGSKDRFRSRLLTSLDSIARSDGSSRHREVFCRRLLLIASRGRVSPFDDRIFG